MRIYSDGSCLTNPGQGGYASLIIDKYNETHLLYGSENYTTNNIMELLAVIKSLYFILDKCSNDSIKIYSDSNYVCKGASNWMYKWHSNEWKTVDGNDVKNKEYWYKIFEYIKVIKEKTQDIEFIWIKSHVYNGNEHNIHNNFVDEKARTSAINLYNFTVEKIIY